MLIDFMVLFTHWWSPDSTAINSVGCSLAVCLIQVLYSCQYQSPWTCLRYVGKVMGL